MDGVIQTDLTIENGNCFHASVATVLGMALDALPVFTEQDEFDGDGWFGPWKRWFSENGIGWVYYQFSEHVHPPRMAPGQILCLGGLSPRYGEQGVSHSVVARYVEDENRCAHFEYVHDPHPAGGFIAGKPIDMLLLWRL